MMSRLATYAALVAASLSTVVAYKGTFLYPTTEGLIFHSGDKVNVSYTSDFKSEATLWIRFRDPQSGEISGRTTHFGLPSPNGSDVFTIDDGGCEECWFSLLDFDHKGSEGFDSVKFSISDKPGNNATFGLGEATTSGSPTGTLTRSSSAGPSTSKTDTDTTGKPTETGAHVSGSKTDTETAGKPTKTGDSHNGGSRVGLSSGGVAVVGLGLVVGFFASL